ncbi:hypothetical protein THAOC_04733 [Thalassiosira oceanica]|uniref:Uncharacterized protein n=1 Tax=Thalassiosira oceanica TaxID=159749 RepID=K0TIM1_THAOC|nr:hypothetical protein THAOC_04733 [Thalassiosira oceanica]|eukprot:EJK73631.1 hypothetical protein THAOC_04733 [Thalassiosira oceanica]
MLVNALLYMLTQLRSGDAMTLAAALQPLERHNLGSLGHGLAGSVSSPTIMAAAAISKGLPDTGLHYGDADEYLGVKMLVVNHSDEPTPSGVRHWPWIIIIALERAALVNILIDYASAIDARVLAFNAGGRGSEVFMDKLRKNKLDVHIPRGVHLTCYTGKKSELVIAFAMHMRKHLTLLFSS